MNKTETIGRIGEDNIVEILKLNNIDFYDMRNNFIFKEIKVNCINRDGKPLNYKYRRKTYTHDFDLKIKNKNVEIKSSSIWKNKVDFSINKNNLKIIDYIIGIVFSDNKEILFYYLFDKKYFSKYKGLNFNINSFRKLNEKEILNKILNF